jgi:hypothetical protein
MGHHHPKSGSLCIAQAFCETVNKSGGDLDNQRGWHAADTISGHHDARYHATTMIRSFLLAAAALAAAVMFGAPAQAAPIDTRFDVCAALRNGTSLATIEATLEARGYSAYNAGALTGTTIRQHCPDQAANAMAQMQRAGA